MNKTYNSLREKLVLPEYGRNVVKMIQELQSIENRDERTEQAHTVIDVMGSINPTLRDSSDYKHKLWDHLFIIAGFNLDIDSPYDLPSADILEVKPDKVEYSRHNFTHKHYGNNIRAMINELRRIQNEGEEDITEYAIDIVKFMRQKSFEYNKEYPSNEVILSDFRRFSEGEIELDENILDATHVSTIRKPRTVVNNRQMTNRNNNSTTTIRRNNNGPHSQHRTVARKTNN